MFALKFIYNETMQFTSHSPQETYDMAFKLGSMIKPPFVLFLDGELGSGKTFFTNAFAKGLGLEHVVNSPTFVMMKIYEGKLRLVHVDAYRLENVTEPIGVLDELDDDTVLVVEWSRYLNEAVTPDLNVKIKIKGESHREITLEPQSDKLCNLEVLCGKL